MARQSSRELPPAYSQTIDTDTDHSQQELERIIKCWDREYSKAVCSCRRMRHETEREGTCRWRPYNVFLGFEPTYQQEFTFKRLCRDRSSQPPWRAVLVIQSSNIPRLMRDGLYWSPSNVVSWQHINLYSRDRKNDKISNETLIRDHMSRKIAPRLAWFLRDPKASWQHHRLYTLENNDPNGKWVGKLLVSAPKASTIVDFDISSITTETTVWAIARDPKRNLVYDTRSRHKREWFNTVAPGMPLRGWWPWPKATISETEKRLEAKNRPSKCVWPWKRKAT